MQAKPSQATHELNVTRAGKRLSISQPALSGQLARLRDLFDDPLLVPSESGRGMVPTQRAIELRPQLSEALAGLRSAVSAVSTFDPLNARRTFVVATNDSVFTIVGLDALERLAAQRNPNLRIAMIPSDDADLVARMERGEVDLFLGDVGKVPDSLKARPLLSDPFEMAQKRGHARGHAPATLDEYCSLAHVIVSQHAAFRTPVDDVLLVLSRSRNVSVVVPSYNQVALALAHTDCVATLPSRLLNRYAATPRRSTSSTCPSRFRPSTWPWRGTLAHSMTPAIAGCASVLHLDESPRLLGDSSLRDSP